MSHPIANLSENTFLAIYVALFLVLVMVAQLLAMQGIVTARFGRRLLTSVILFVASAHLAADVAHGRIGEHWTGREKFSANYLLPAEAERRNHDPTYLYYWGPDRRTLFYSRGGRRFAALPCVFLGAFGLTQFVLRD